MVPGNTAGSRPAATGAVQVKGSVIGQAHGHTAGPGGGLPDGRGGRRPPVAAHGNGESGFDQLEDVKQVARPGGHRRGRRNVAGPQHGQEHHHPGSGVGQVYHHDPPCVADSCPDLFGCFARRVPEVGP